jgi:Mrp family chromosome partitioning ATPase/capsular polysaccharide biosynthesis protein
MEPVDFGKVLLRSWRWLLVFAIAGGVVGALLPVSTHKNSGYVSWSTTAVAGAPPSSGPGANAGLQIEQGVSTDQILFYAQSAQVAQVAGSLVGLHQPASQLESAISIQGPTKKSGLPGVVQITGTQPTRSLAAAFTNAFANTLGSFMNSRLAAKQQAQVRALQATAARLNSEIDSVGPSTPAAAGLQNQLNSTEAQIQALSGSNPTSGFQVLQPAQANLAVEKVNGQPSKLTTLGASRKVRGLIGLLVGLLVGAAIVLTREVLDRRLRSKSRARVSFGYPVVAEIPQPPAGRSGNGSLVDVVRDPASPTAEAYRMLRMSLLFEAMPILPAFDNGTTQVYGSGYHVPALTPGQPEGAAWPEAANGGAYPGGGHNGGPHAGEARAPGNGAAQGGLPERAQMMKDRKVVLVVSPGTEQTRPFVVANLAATYAEAGQQVIVMTTADVHSAGRFGAEPAPVDHLTPEQLESYLEPSTLDNVWRLSWRHFVSVSGQLVTRAPTILKAARELADVVLVEAPSVLAVADGEALTASADVMLVVGDTQSTTIDDARRTGELLRRIGAPVLGVVLTGVELPRRDVRHLVPDPAAELMVLGGDPGTGVHA